MGRESKVEYVDARERVPVRAHLDSLNLQLTGGKKLTVPLSDVTEATVEADQLKIVAGKAKFALSLGAREAELWRKKILSPPTLADKLGFKGDKSVVLVGSVPREIVEAAKAAKVGKGVAKLPPALTHDIAVVALSPGKETAQIGAAARALKSGAAWLVYAKGRAINGDDIILLARKAGLSDTKVARVSDTHAALRFIRAKS